MGNEDLIHNLHKVLKKNKIRVSLFIEPRIKDIKHSYILGADCVELHTGKLSDLIKLNKDFSNEFIVFIKESYKEDLGFGANFSNLSSERAARIQ